MASKSRAYDRCCRDVTTEQLRKSEAEGDKRSIGSSGDEINKEFRDVERVLSLSVETWWCRDKTDESLAGHGLIFMIIRNCIERGHLVLWLIGADWYHIHDV